MEIIADELIGGVQEIEEVYIREQRHKRIIGKNNDGYLYFILP